MTTLEIIAVCFGLANIMLLIRRSIWNYPFGIVMVALYFVFFQEQRLYSEMLLQIFFAVVQAAGWFAWWRTGGLDGPIAVRRMPVAERFVWPIGIAVGIGFWGFTVVKLTDGVAPFWDASIAIGSVAAQILLVRRMIENWLLWIAVDILAIGLYFNRGIYPTAGLYVVFLIMCFIGWFEWRRAESRGAEPA
jgi:nicotinamide mononucleotide transporter